MPNKLLLFIMSILCVTAQSAFSKEDNMLKVKISAEASKVSGLVKVFAKLNFKNESNKAIEIPKYLIGEGLQPTNAFFEVIANNSEITYIGEMVKRAVPKKNDLVIIKPSQEILGSFDISASYKWLPVKSNYQIKYVGLNLKSEEATFSF